MQLEAISRKKGAVATHSLAMLLDCPPAVGTLLNASAKSIDFEADETVFRQSESCKGLYLIVSGRFLRKTERLNMHLTLGMVHAGDLVELAAVLGSGQHTYSLNAQSSGSVLLLPAETLSQVFQNYPLMRMHLLEELAREVCRAYYACSFNRATKARHHHSGAAVA